MGAGRPHKLCLNVVLAVRRSVDTGKLLLKLNVVSASPLGDVVSCFILHGHAVPHTCLGPPCLNGSIFTDSDKAARDRVGNQSEDAASAETISRGARVRRVNSGGEGPHTLCFVPLPELEVNLASLNLLLLDLVFVRCKVLDVRSRRHPLVNGSKPLSVLADSQESNVRRDDSSAFRAKVKVGDVVSCQSLSADVTGVVNVKCLEEWPRCDVLFGLRLCGRNGQQELIMLLRVQDGSDIRQLGGFVCCSQVLGRNRHLQTSEVGDRLQFTARQDHDRVVAHLHGVAVAFRADYQTLHLGSQMGQELLLARLELPEDHDRLFTS